MANRTCLKGTHLLTQVLAVGVQVVQDTGNFVSKKDAKNFPSVSTAETVKNVLESSDQTFADHAIKKQANQTMAARIQVFVENWHWRGFGSGTPANPSVNSDYVKNLKSVFKNSTVTDREIPIAISAIGVFDRENQKQQIKEIYAESEYVGTLKKREKFFLKVIERRTPSTGGYLYKCITRELNLVHFFAEKDFPFEIGDCILINATAVEHKKSQYDHDNKTTRLNRVVLIENYGQPKADSQPVSG